MTETVTIIRIADLVPRPWKNGGGVTMDIAISPEGAGFEDFDWRISIAEVATDGTFSLFPGIDRTLAVIDGQVLALIFGDGRAQTLTSEDDTSFAFPGDAPVMARLKAGPIRDLNVMTRRERLTHRVHKVRVSSGVHSALDYTVMMPSNPSEPSFVVCTCGTLKIEAGNQAVELGRDAVCRVSGHGRLVVRTDGPATYFLIVLERK